MRPERNLMELIEDQPVVCRREKAMNCFLRTKMEMLMVGVPFVERAGA